MSADGTGNHQRRAFALLLAGATVFAAFSGEVIWRGLPDSARELFWAGEFGKIPTEIRKNAVMTATVDFDDAAYPVFHDISPLPSETDEAAWGRKLKTWEGLADIRIRVGEETSVFVFYGQIRAALRKPGDRVTLEIRPFVSGGATRSVTLARPAGCKTDVCGFGYNDYEALLLARTDCCPQNSPEHFMAWSCGGPPSLRIRVDDDGILCGEAYDGDEPLEKLLRDERNSPAADIGSGFFVFEVPEMMPAAAFVEFLKLVESRPEIRHCGIVLAPDRSSPGRHSRKDFLPAYAAGRHLPPVR